MSIENYIQVVMDLTLYVCSAEISHKFYRNQVASIKFLIFPRNSNPRTCPVSKLLHAIEC